MIGSLRGTLSELLPGDAAVEIVLEVAGVGYRVLVANRTAAALGPIGSDVALKVHTHVREGAITLYGFTGAIERQCFEVLVATHGVGPSLGLAVLGVYEPYALAGVLAAGDIDALILVPGIGRKTATRLLVELGQRLDGLLVAGPPESASSRTDTGGADTAGAAQRRARASVGEALAGLGYGPDEVQKACATLPDEGTAEELLRLALASLAPPT